MGEFRLIDANALKRIIKTECNPYGNPTIDFESGKKVLKIIDNAPTKVEIKIQDTYKKFGDLKKGDKFSYDKDLMIKTCRIKAGNDGAFYTAVSIVTGNHYCITDDLEVYV